MYTSVIFAFSSITIIMSWLWFCVYLKMYTGDRIRTLSNKWPSFWVTSHIFVSYDQSFCLFTLDLLTPTAFSIQLSAFCFPSSAASIIRCNIILDSLWDLQNRHGNSWRHWRHAFETIYPGGRNPSGKAKLKMLLQVASQDEAAL